MPKLFAALGYSQGMPPELITGLTITILLVLLSLFWPRHKQQRPRAWTYALGVVAVAAFVFVMLRYQGMVSDALHAIP